MQTKTFRALGHEGYSRHNPLVWFSLLGFVLSLVLVLSWAHGVISWSWFWSSLTGLLFLASIVSFFVLRVMILTGINEFDVTISDARDSGGDLRLSYHQSGGKRGHDSLLVKGVKSYPHSPLTKEVWRGGRTSTTTPVKGTSASLVVDFERANFWVKFGFPSESEMNEVYSMLKE